MQYAVDQQSNSKLNYPQISHRYFLSLYEAVFRFHELFCVGTRCMDHLHL